LNAIRGPLSDDARRVTGECLQAALVDLIDLSLSAKQAHWNLIGRSFRSIHLQLDDVVAMARQYADLVAERAITIGVNPDGRAQTVASRSGLDALDAGYLQDDKVIAAFIDRLGHLANRMRERIATTAEPDPVTQDLLIDATKQIEMHYWMFQAER
jgi:starvation-inducible DNA-binding protein